MTTKADVADMLADLLASKAEQKARQANAGLNNWPEPTPCHLPSPGCVTLWSLKKDLILRYPFRRKDGSTFACDLLRGPSYLPADVDPPCFEEGRLAAMIKAGHVEIYAPGEKIRITPDHREAAAKRVILVRPRDVAQQGGPSDPSSSEALEHLAGFLTGQPKAYALAKAERARAILKHRIEQEASVAASGTAKTEYIAGDQ